MTAQKPKSTATRHMQLTPEIERWRKSWIARHGGPPKILHIGNIANNAYNNAKLLIDAGFECDVICYDYYHIMGCPEWEDADFSGDVDDHFKPDWTAVVEDSYERPRWFAQGPMELCIDYLIARRKGAKRDEKEAWRLLSEVNGSGNKENDLSDQSPYCRVRMSLSASYLKIRAQLLHLTMSLLSPPSRLHGLLASATAKERGLRARILRLLETSFYHDVWRKLKGNRGDTHSVLRKPAGQTRQRLSRPTELLKRFGKHLSEIANGRRVRWSRLCQRFSELIRNAIGRASSFISSSIPIVLRNTLVFIASSIRFAVRAALIFMSYLSAAIYYLYLVCARAVLFLAVFAYEKLALFVHGLGRMLKLIKARRTAKDAPSLIPACYERLSTLYGEANFDRDDALLDTDIIPNLATLPRWQQLFSHYDVILGYSTDPIWPLMAGRKYFAMEHGTLREIPFTTDRQGRLTSLSYHYAEHVFVTNFDCIPNAKRLCGDRFSFVNHPYDEDHGLAISGVDEMRRNYRELLDAEFLVFFPTRQDWVPGTGFADKANDVFIRAFCQLREQGYRIGMICCDWGNNVSQTKSLLAEHGCGNAVSWEEPMGIIRFERVARACDIVADQFKLGAFGGVTFKALAVGVPVCTFLDAGLLHGLYSALPPVINCSDKEAVVSELESLMNNRDRLESISKESRNWIKTYHSGRDLVICQVEKFMTALENEKVAI